MIVRRVEDLTLERRAQIFAECLRLPEVASKFPPCPTCGGSPEDFFGEAGMYERCPDCVDGKVSIEQLAATWRAVWTPDLAGRYTHGITYGEGWRACIDYLRAVRPQ